MDKGESDEVDYERCECCGERSSNYLFEYPVSDFEGVDRNIPLCDNMVCRAVMKAEVLEFIEKCKGE